MSAKATVFGTIAWAVGFLVSAVALKGNPIGDWIEGALLAGWIVFVSLAARSTANHRRSGPTGRH
jgi:hypothetical protein